MDWDFTDTDPMLPSRWRFGTIHQGGHGQARNLATGRVPAPDGSRRLAHVFDHEQAGRITGAVAAVHAAAAAPAAIELRLASAPLPDDAGLSPVGTVGSRVAFTTDAVAARPLLTPELARAVEEVGADIPLLWVEDAWVLAAAPGDITPERTQRLLLALVDVALAVEPRQDGTGNSGQPPPAPRRSG